MTIRPGDLLFVGRAASVQFAGDRGIRLRVVSIEERPTYDGWLWLTGYVLDDSGTATDKREIYVQRAGLRRLDERRPPAQRRAVRPAVPPATRVVP